jgi:hypothetical protein
MASATATMYCKTDDLKSYVLDLVATTDGHPFCTVELCAGLCSVAVHLQRNAHALAVAERAFRAVADRLAEIQTDAAGQERVDLATVEAALALGNYTGGEE